MTAAYSVSGVTVRDDAPSATFRVKRSGTSDDLQAASSVDFLTEDVTAVAGTDYTATNGTLGFGKDVTEATIVVEILPDAYTKSTSIDFLLSLAGYGTTSGTIVPCTSKNTTQTYILVPEERDKVAVPRHHLPGDNLKYQANYRQFSSPTNKLEEMPLAYIRFGHARADMNDYERMVVNSAAYQPAWDGHKEDGTPIEMASMIHMMRPRGLDRRDMDEQQVRHAMKDNAHLDGLFLYSDKNYIVSVKGHMNTTIQGNEVLFVNGDSRILRMGASADWYYWSMKGYLRWASGVDKVNGIWWEYEISACYLLEITADKSITYSIGPSFSACASYEICVSNAAKYEVSNSISLAVKGLELSATCDVEGNFEVKAPTIGRASTQETFSQAVSKSITLSVETGLSNAWTVPVKAAAIANALAAAAATTASWVIDYSPQGSFYKNATVEGMKEDYSEPFLEAVPDTIFSLSVLTAITVLIAAYQQKVATVVPILPMISMDAAGLLLSANETCSIYLTAAGITMTAPTIELSAGAIAIDAEGTFDVSAPAIEAVTEAFTIAGNLDVEEALSVTAGATVMGSLFAETLVTG